MTFPLRSRLAVRAFLGPWVGHGAFFYKLIGKQNRLEAASSDMGRYLTSERLAQRLLRPQALADPLSAVGGIYAAPAGPGGGKTIEKMLGAFVTFAANGCFAILFISLGPIESP